MVVDAPPDIAALLKRHSIPDSAKKQLAGFTEQSIKVSYAHAVQEELRKLGYDVSVTSKSLADGDTLKWLDTYANDRAQSIITTYNQMLANQLGRDSSPEAVNGFFDRVDGYNKDVLIPFDSASARQQAVNDVYANNGIETQWMCEPAETAGCDDECDDAVDASPMSSDEAGNFSFPVHPNCPHELVPLEPDASTLPDQADVWAG